MVLPALTSICEEVAEAVILLLTVLHLFVGEHIVRCNAAGTHELLHEPVTSAVKPRLRDCSRLSRLQVGPAGSADGVVPVLEAKPVPAVQVVSAYDRLGNKNEVRNLVRLATGDLFDYSSASIVSAINNSVAKTSRSCWASDIQERTVFHDCDVGAGANSATVDVDFNSNASKVGYFSPLLLLGLRLAAAPQSDIVVQVLIEQTYYFTFRNPKYGGSSTSTVSTRSAAVESVSGVPLMAQRSDTRRLDTEGDMDDSGGLDDEDAAAAAPAARVQRSTPLSALWDRSRAPRP